MTKDPVSNLPVMTLVTSPGPNKGPFPKEVRFRLTEQQYAFLETARGHDNCARYIRDRLFYASPSEVSVIGAIGSVHQAAGQVIDAAREMRAQAARLERTWGHMAAIVERQPGAPWPDLPKHVVHAMEAVNEQADHLLALGLKLDRHAVKLGVAEMRRVLAEKAQPEIQPRPRPSQ